MSTWYLNGVNVNACGIEDLTITYRNMDVDQCVLTCVTDLAPTIVPLYQYGAAIAITRDSTVVFRGIVTAYKPSEAGPEYVVITASGPWWYFEKAVYDAVTTFRNNTTGLPEAGWSSRITVSGLISAYALLAAQRIQEYGHISVAASDIALPTLQLPQTTYTNTTCAELLRSILRYIQGAVVWFDYRSNPPRFHCQWPNTATSITLARTDGIKSMSYHRRADLAVPGIRLIYERAITVHLDGVDTQQFEVAGVDTYPVGSSLPIGSIRNTIQLSGSRRYVSQTIQCDSSCIEARIPNNATNYDRATVRAFNAYFDPLVARFDTTNSDAWYSLTLRNLMFKSLAMEGSGFTASNMNPVLPGSPVLDPDLYAIMPYWECTATIGWHYTATWETGRPEYDYTSRFVFYAVYGAYRGLVKTRTMDDTIEAVPVGVARQLYDGLAFIHHEGEVVVEADEPLPITGAAKVVISPDNITGMIQQTELNIAQGTTKISFGPPSHLGPQDYLALLRQ